MTRRDVSETTGRTRLEAADSQEDTFFKTVAPARTLRILQSVSDT